MNLTIIVFFVISFALIIKITKQEKESMELKKKLKEEEAHRIMTRSVKNIGKDLEECLLPGEKLFWQ